MENTILRNKKRTGYSNWLLLFIAISLYLQLLNIFQPNLALKTEHYLMFDISLVLKQEYLQQNI